MTNRNSALKGKLDVTYEEAVTALKNAKKDEVLVIRLNRKRKTEIAKRAHAAGVTMTAYLLMAEQSFARSHNSEK